MIILLATLCLIKGNMCAKLVLNMSTHYLLRVQTNIVISPDKARKGVIYPLKTGIYALVGISERTFTR